MRQENPDTLSTGPTRRKILVVGTAEGFSEAVIEYAIQLALRLDHDLLIVGVVGKEAGRFKASSPLGIWKIFKPAPVCSAEVFRRRAGRFGIRCDLKNRSEGLETAVARVLRETRRIEFAVTETEADREAVAGATMIPVFSVTSQTNGTGGKKMKPAAEAPKKNYIGKTVGYGFLTAVFYAAVFWNVDSVMNLFTQGGWYAALPVGTAFAFSFSHGAFAGSIWSLLGIKARTQVRQKVAISKEARKVKSARKRPRAYAYINPFHRI